jgi:hypothetical protein
VGATVNTRAAIRSKYRRSWFAQPTGATNLRILVTSVAVVFLIVGVIWVAGNSSAQARYEAERALYENDLTEYNQCQTRVASSAKLSDLANANSVLAEAQDKLGASLVHTFDAIYQLASDPESETARAFGAIIAQLREDVAEVSEASAVVKEAASQYDRVDPSTCPPEPTPPGG